ncbi:Cenp-O kinetochore centromere component-domain-containing protein [Thelonectria olida]|uniref:Cenp-O kinetochore centromere component-domain-containing protein n=1 Tax=Thelonectria olida TaxID=1576542 RepID=A0A9P9APJ6_9HYPO|nr:Cenp-O kinetochore centromere component-domain-containing protein [Thelonectria olida]
MSQDPPPADSDLLNDEIAALKEQAAALRKTLQIESSTILSASSTQSILKPSAMSRTRATDHSRTKILAESEKQRAYIQQCLYRICTSVTSFKVHDPDPNAADGGHVLGLRFEVMSKGQFLRPYYVMLNRPYPGYKHLRIHRHTLPPAIPLPGLAARHLPAPKTQNDNPVQQDLDRFVRTLRREVVRYHNRLGVSADLRRGLGLHEKTSADLTASDIVEVGIADIEAKQIRLTWADERSGRVVMDDDGKVLKLVVFGKQGRDWETTKELYDNYGRIEDVTKKLQEYAQG